MNVKVNETADVSVLYYPETSKGHDIATIAFLNDADQIIDMPRVKLGFNGEDILFQKDNDGHGMRLNFGKIQVWSMAKLLKGWEGKYPLKFSIEHGCYFIRKTDKIKGTGQSNLGSRLGAQLNYTPHSEEVVSAVNVELKNKGDSDVEIKEPLSVTPEKVVIRLLFDKLRDKLEGNEEAKALLVTLQVLLNI